MEKNTDYLAIHKLLVANRGEIAIRVLRAASELGIRTVAIFTHEDRYSLHKFKSDEAYQIGRDDEALKPYLDIDTIVSIAKEKGVDAIHPGYGFLSENVEFAKKCKEAGIKFIGPTPEAMSMLGDKVAAKKIAEKNGTLIRAAKASLDGIEETNLSKRYRLEQGYTFEMNLMGIGDQARDAFLDK